MGAHPVSCREHRESNSAEEILKPVARQVVKFGKPSTVNYRDDKAMSQPCKDLLHGQGKAQELYQRRTAEH